jgi:hypothetical protein
MEKIQLWVKNPLFMPHRFPDEDLSILIAVETSYQYYSKKNN